MKTFEDLDFRPHPNGYGSQAIMFFGNGYGISVITGPLYYSDVAHPYEAAILSGYSFNDLHLCYSTPIADDVIGHLTKSGVTKIMKKIQKL